MLAFNFKTAYLLSGSQHMVRLSAMSLSSSDSIRDLEVSQRGCLFPYEEPPGVPLKFYSEYSHHTCLFECALTLVAKLEGCTPWYLPRLVNSTMCDPWQAAEFTKLLETTWYKRGEEKQIGFYQTKQPCPPQFLRSSSSGFAHTLNQRDHLF